MTRLVSVVFVLLAAAPAAAADLSAGSPAASPAPAAVDAWPEMDALNQRISELSAELNQTNLDVVRRYGRNDTPEALAILEPLRNELHAAEAARQKLVECPGHATAPDVFASLGIGTNEMGLPASEALEAYVESRYVDGTLDAAGKARFWKILQARSRGIMNPGSRGASQSRTAILGALACAGIDTPPAPGAKPVRPSTNITLLARTDATHTVSLYGYHLANIGKTDGTFAPVLPTADGGALVVGTRNDLPPDGKFVAGRSHPMVLRYDPYGHVVWQKDLRRKGYEDFEGGSAVQTPDGGFIVFVLDYVKASRGGANRLVKLKPDGTIAWDWCGRGDGTKQTPFASKLVQLTPQGTVLLAGHIYLTQGGPLNAWTGEVRASDGKLLRDQVGDSKPE